MIYLLIPVVLFSFDSFKLNLLIEYFVSAPPFRHWNTKRARFLYKLVLPCEYQTTIVILLTIQLCPIGRVHFTIALLVVARWIRQDLGESEKMGMSYERDYL